MHQRRNLLLALAALTTAAAAWPGAALAQAGYPNKPIKFIVPY